MMWILDKLTIRILIIFLIISAFFLAFIIITTDFDSINQTYLSTKARKEGIAQATAIEKQLMAITITNENWKEAVVNLIDTVKNSGQFFYVVTPNNQIISSDQNNIDIVRDFSKLTNKSANLTKKVYDEIEIIGPFNITYYNKYYQLYIIQKAPDKQWQLFSIIFSNPFLLFLIILLVSCPFLLWLSWSLAKPVKQLKKAAEQVARGNIQEWPDLEKLGSAEFKETGASFNHMLRELKRMQEIQQRFLSDISHELRTPLTRLKLAAALSKRKYGETKESERIEIEGQKLDAMIKELLLLAKQQYSYNESQEPCQINKLCKPLIESAIFEAEQLNKSFILASTLPEEWILCSPQGFSSALENIIRNAFYYANRLIEMKLQLVENLLTITIDDDGSGVLEEELQQIFKPFYRVNDEKDRESGGAGLGLAIVMNAITQDNGEVYAEKSHLGGLRIVIKLPLYNQQQEK